MARQPSYDRDLALDQAVELFWEKGYHASSLKQIEQALDMRPGSIYASFGSKDGLFSEALARYAGHGAKALAEHMASYTSVIDGLKGYLRDIARDCSDESRRPSKACLIVKTLLESSRTHPVMSQQANAFLADIEEGLKRWLERARDQGELDASVDCRRLARFIQGQIMALRIMAERPLPPDALTALGEDMAATLDPFLASPRPL
ncbi:TetR/AcrR family transcriptional regulator [Marinobacter sp. C2H3]|uniref:TetR/AcrR family transcriptional regulator n=1 Tax=Marinobacter sp. C2H3 TaxID=3119003 RepID=UPI00300EDAAA